MNAPVHGTPAVPPERYAPLSLPQKLLVASFLAVGVYYLAWRPTAFNPDAPLFSALIYGVELFGFAGALLFLVMCWKLKTRTPLAPPEGASVAVFVPTINESVEIVRRTLLAAQRMPLATEVWLLDDGNRGEMRALAGAIGCRYLARSGNTHAKAGNLNNALGHCDAEFIAIFDADHAPAASFLKETLGFFADPRVAFVQTPQDFYNLDSFQHRVDPRESLVWSEQSLFFRVIQAGKDRLNAAFFCGSCAVVRRAALDDIGGFATGSVTEDIHTSLKLHKRGWRSVYYARSLAFGLAPATVIPFLKQRLRWGQGAMQVWRQEGILFARGLSFGQRVSYLATMLAYFEGWQRAVLFMAPVIVLTTGVMPIMQVDAEFLLRFIPYYVLTFWVFEEVGRGYGRSLLTEQYNMLRFAVFLTATFGYFLRRLAFVVTPKTLGEGRVTHRNLWPQYLIVALNALAIPAGVFLHVRSGALPLGALIANIMWAALVLVVGAVAIRFTLRVSAFRRREYRFPVPMPVRVRTDKGELTGVASAISPLGFQLSALPEGRVREGDRLECVLLLPGASLPLTAVVRARQPAEEGEPPAYGCAIAEIAPADRNQLELFLFGSDLQWHLNGLEERVRPPLERLADLFRPSSAREARLGPHRWSPLVYGDDEAGSTGVAFVSSPAVGPRTLVALRSLPDREDLRADELTPQGPRSLAGRLGEARLLETHASPLYLYRLSA